MRDTNKQNTIQTQTIHEVRAKQIGTSWNSKNCFLNGVLNNWTSIKSVQLIQKSLKKYNTNTQLKKSKNTKKTTQNLWFSMGTPNAYSLTHYISFLTISHSSFIGKLASLHTFHRNVLFRFCFSIIFYRNTFCRFFSIHTVDSSFKCEFNTQNLHGCYTSLELRITFSNQISIENSICK